MRVSDAARGLGVVIVVALGVAAVLIAGSTVSGPVSPPADSGYPSTGALLPDEASATGSIDVPDTGETGTVVVDAAHGNRFAEEDLRPLLSALSRAGHDVTVIGPDDDLSRALSRARAFVVVDPAVPYRTGEAQTVKRFAESGGRVAVFGEPTRVSLRNTGFGTAVGRTESRLGALGSHLGIQFGTEYLYNLAENEGNFKRIFASGTGPYGDLGRVALYTATTVTAPEGRDLLSTTPGTQLSGTSEPARHAVAVRRDAVLAVGDASLLSAGKVSVADNEVFLSRVVGFLTGGERSPTLGAYPAFLDADPVVAYTDDSLLAPAQTMAAGLRAAGADPTLQFGNPRPGETDVLLATYDYLAANDVGTDVNVSGGTVRVLGHVVSRGSTSLIRTGGPGYDLVVAVPGASAGREAVRTLVDGEAGRFGVTDRLAIVGHERTPAPPPGASG